MFYSNKSSTIKTKIKINLIVTKILSFMPFWLVFNVFWFGDKFDNPSIDQIIFHLQYGMAESDIDRSLIVNYVLRGIFYPLILTIIFFILRGILSRAFPNYLPIKLSFRFIPWILIFFALAEGFHRFKVIDFLTESKLKDDVIATYYLDPREITLAPKNPKNLILIYVESLEKSYANESVFRKNLISPLESLTGVEIQNYIQMPGTGWTMGGIVSTQCSIPLKVVALGDENSQGKFYKTLLPNAECLGDTLKRNGYYNVFLGGASLKFSGKGKFLSSHGYDRVIGKEEWLSTGLFDERDLNGWGLFDKDVLSQARKELDILESKKGHFNLTILTLDTHFSRGYMSDKCAASLLDKAGGLEEIIECSSAEVADFVNYAKNKGYLKNTNILIIGDHLSMPSTIYPKLKKIQRRTIYNKWISEDIVKFNRDTVDHFDIAPTVLDFIGLNVEGARYGLGYSSLSKKTLPPIGLYHDLESGLVRSSPFYNSFWVRPDAR